MKYAKIALALAAVALLMVPAAAPAARKHHLRKHPVKTCPKGKHRNGRNCVKNWQAAPRGPAGANGPAGQPPVMTRSTVYDNITSLSSNPRSSSFSALDFDEFGSLVALAGTNRSNPQVTVDTAVYACETGTYSSGCSTTPGTKFEIPMTVRLYAVAAGQEPGALLGTETVNQQLHYRPTSDPTCTTAPYAGGFRNGAGVCVNGQLEPVSFNLAGLTLPNEVIVSLSYNTTEAGYGQHPPLGAPADSVNVALAGPAAVGTTLRETEGSYFASGFYGSADDVFQYQVDEEFHETVGSEPAISISATN